MVTVAGITTTPAVELPTVTVSGGSATVSSTGVRVNAAAATVARAGIVRVKGVTAAKSAVPAVTPVTESSITVGVERAAPSRRPVRVTTVAPAPSATTPPAGAATARRTRGMGSSSAMRPSARACARVACAGSLRVTVRSSPSSWRSSSTRVTARVRSVTPGAKVSVPPAAR